MTRPHDTMCFGDILVEWHGPFPVVKRTFSRSGGLPAVTLPCLVSLFEVILCATVLKADLADLFSALTATRFFGSLYLSI